MNKLNSRNDKILDIIIEEAMEKYAVEISKEDVPCNMTEQEIQTMMLQKEAVLKKVKQQIKQEFRTVKNVSFRKWYIVAVASILLFAIGINASAFRIFIFKTYTDLVGHNLRLETSQITDKDYDVISEFIYKDEVIIPEWLPPGTELVSISDDESGIIIYYKDKNNFLTLHEYALQDADSTTGIETQNNEVDIKNINILGMPGVIVKTKSETQFEAYTVRWNSENMVYEITTNYSKIMLDAILQNLSFYK